MLFVAGPLAYGQEPHQLRAILQFDSLYPPGKWLPVRMEFINESGQDIDSWGVVPSGEAPRQSLMRVPVQVPARSWVIAFNYGYFPMPGEPTAQVPFPPLSIPTWQRKAGGMVTRTDILGRPMFEEGSPENVANLLLLVSGRQAPGYGPAHDLTEFAQAIGRMVRRPILTPRAEPRTIPPHWIGYDACAAVLLDGLDPDTLDLPRRRALLDYVAAGGVLIVSAPREQDRVAQSWLAPYLPVQLIGERQINQVEPLPPFAGAPLATREWVGSAEALPGNGTLVLQEHDYVHAAYQPVGFGRIVFTSFPINALDWEDPRTGQIWRTLLALDLPPLDWRETRLAREHERAMESMVGLPAARWVVAAGVILGYLLLIGGIQFAFGGVRRPAAFAAACALAAVLTVALIAAGSLQRRVMQLELTEVALAIVDMGPEGGGHHQSLHLWFGADDARMDLTSTEERTTLRAVEPGPAPALISTAPFSATHAGVHAARIERIWEVRSLLPTEKRIRVAATFGPQGPRFVVDNEAYPLEAPLLVWRGRNVPLEDLPLGNTTVTTLRPPNPAGDFAHVGIFSPERAKVRGDMLRASLLPRSESLGLVGWDHPPLLAGWIAEADAPRPMQALRDQPPPMRAQTLLRTPIVVEPSPPGTRVLVPHPFTRLVPADRGGPYDPVTREWQAVRQGGSWLVAVESPPQIGALRPLRIHLDAEISAAHHTITLRRQQSAGAAPRMNPNGEIVARWRQQLGRQSRITFQPSEQDYDAQGRLWLLIEVEAPELALSNWHIHELSAEMEAEVIAPPDEVH